MKQIKSECIDKITHKVYLGDIYGTKELDYFKQEKIGGIISLTTEETAPTFNDKSLQHLCINIGDSPEINIIQHFKKCIDFIESSSQNTYVHCMCGVSRSSSIVIAYIMWKNKIKYYDAYFFVKNKRPFICPNDGFIDQLKMFEKLLINNNYNLDQIDFSKIEWPKK